VGLNALKSLNLTHVYPNKNKNNKNNNKVKSKPLELRSRVKTPKIRGEARAGDRREKSESKNYIPARRYPLGDAG
jgi:hypothetical protein